MFVVHKNSGKPDSYREIWRGINRNMAEFVAESSYLKSGQWCQMSNNVWAFRSKTGKICATITEI